MINHLSGTLEVSMILAN